MSPDPLKDALFALSQFLIADVSLGDTLHRVSEIAQDAMASAEAVGISMLGDDGRPTTAIYTDDTAPEVDASQYESGNGPCLQAWRTKRVVYIENMKRAADDYPEFARSAIEHGVLSTLSLPLIVADNGVGALNLYARVEAAFSEDDCAVGIELAAAAAVVLANAEAYWRAYELSENLAEAMKSRAVIEQAKGMLMAQSPKLSADDAFEVLRKASQRENVKLREIAQRIVERRAGPGAERV
jgi:GAF domain-containing protein